MDGMGGGAGAQSAMNSTKQQFESVVKDFQANPAAASGIPEEELARRRAEAQAARNVQIGDKSFNIRSTARSQQIMQKGTNKLQYKKRMEEIKEKMAMFRYARVVVIATTVMAFYIIGQNVLLPRYVVFAERSRRNQMRFEERFLPTQQHKLQEDDKSAK